jgi:glycosyltransferase involved in cell wall biosynthesis
MITVIIPAHNEAAVIAHTLDRLLDGPNAERLDVVVVCNGCSDATAEIARRRDGARVIELQQASKTAALNAGDALSTCFPRFYVDADVTITADDVILAAQAFKDGVHAVSPTMVPQLDGRPWIVRAFYSTWLQLPYCGSLIGSGVFGLDLEGRSRFDQFPPVIADDLFARLHTRPEERAIADEAIFELETPKTVSSLIKVKTRAHLGWLQLRDLQPELFANEDADHNSALRELIRSPSNWPRVSVYIGVRYVSRWRAVRQHRRGHHHLWERDETTRKPSATAIAAPHEPEHT